MSLITPHQQTTKTLFFSQVYNRKHKNKYLEFFLERFKDLYRSQTNFIDPRKKNRNIPIFSRTQIQAKVSQ